MIEVTMTHSEHGHTCIWNFADRAGADAHIAEHLEAGWFVRTVKEVTYSAKQGAAQGAKRAAATPAPTAEETRQAGFRAALWRLRRIVPAHYQPQAAEWLAGYDLFQPFDTYLQGGKRD